MKRKMCALSLLVGMIVSGFGASVNASNPVLVGLTIPIRVPVAVDLGNQIGKPYSMGTAGPDSFDCSGLVWYVYRNRKIDVGKTHSSCDMAQYLYNKGKGISSDELVICDLVFYDLSSRNDDKFRKIDHVSAYVNKSSSEVIIEARPDHGVVYSGRRNKSKEKFYADPFV
ncbi:MAG: C40 family peptidase [Clostridiales bacterium]|nr:C40 family peptidase [Clostridiales bacterium]